MSIYLGKEKEDHIIMEWNDSFNELVKQFPDCIWYDKLNSKGELEVFMDTLNRKGVGEVWR
jgi:hypothetical protein